jgi:hypothetical protein
MRALIAISVLLVCTAVQAAGLKYFGCRKWIEQQCATNTTPQDERLFVGRILPPTWASIVRFHRGVTLREIIDGTPLRGKTVLVRVMRPDDSTKMGLFTRPTYIKVEPSDKPNYELKPLDVIWLCDDGPIIET